MSMLLVRKAYRDVLAMGVRALLVVLVIGAGVGTAAGIGLALRDVQASRDAFYRDNALADIDLRLAETVPPRVLIDRAERAGATTVLTRLILPGLVEDANGQLAAEVVGMPARSPLNRLAITSGRGLSGSAPHGAVVETDYARDAGLRLGDRLTLSLGGQRLTVRVRGLGRSPEYLLATANPDYLIPERGSLAVVFLPRDGLAAAVGIHGRVNDLAVDLPAGRALGPAGRTLAAGLPVARLTPRTEQYSVRFTDADLHSFSLFVPVLGGVFAAVGFLLIAMSLRRLVHAQRRELGTLLAIGYRRSAVIATVILPAVLLAIPGALVSLLMTLAVARLVAVDYAAAVGFPRTVFTHDPGILAGAAAAAIAVTLASALVPAWMLVRLDPAQAMHGETLVRFAAPAWLRAGTGRAGPELSYAGRSLLRRPLLSIATVASLALAIGLGASMNLLITSTDRAVNLTFDGQGWTAVADLAGTRPAEEVRRIARAAGARSTEPVIKGPASLRAGERRSSATLVGLPARPALQRLRLVAGTGPGPGTVVISEQTADDLGVGVGDRLAVRTAAGRGRLTVSGIDRTLASGQAYLRFAVAGRLLGTGSSANAMYLDALPAVIDALRNDPAVARVTPLDSARQGMRDLVAELITLIDVLLAISLAVGALFLVSSLALSLLDREPEFATLRALGYGRGRIIAILGSEALGQAVLAGALAVPAGLLIAWPLSERIGQAWFRIGIHPAASDFTVVIALALALAVLAAINASRTVIRLDIAAAVRARLIG